MTPVILVGLRLGDGGYRDRNWAYSKARWEQTLGWSIYEGHYDYDPFSLARASNRAATAAGDWETAFYVGADFLLVDASQARDAAERARLSGQLTFAHDILIQLDERETIDLIEAGPVAHPVGAGKRHPNTYSGALAVPRTLWDAVGGFDERFVDWGFDDLAFLDACNALGGGYQRIPGVAYHLWHPRSWEENEGNPHHSANQVLWERYRAVKSDRSGMLSLVSEPGASRA